MASSAVAPASSISLASITGMKLSSKELELVIRISCLVCICILAFAIRLFSMLRFESVIHESDPYFNYRATIVLVTKGYYEFFNWFDHESWYPLGHIVGQTVYPGIMVTAATIYWTLEKLTFMVTLRNVCMLTPPIFAALTALVAYFFGCELRDRRTGLTAAALMAICPGYIARSVAGAFDNESVAMPAMLLTFLFFLKAVRTGSALWAAAAALVYFFMVSAWGGYIFVINLLPVYVVVLMLCGRWSSRVYVAYSAFYVLSTLLAMQLRHVGGSHYVQAGEHLAAMGVFAFLQVYAFTSWVKGKVADPAQWEALRRVIVLVSASVSLAAFGLAVGLGKISPWTGRFYALLDPSYARQHLPIISSVADMKPTTWASFFFDLHLLMFLVPPGMYFCFKRATDAAVFVLIYAFFSLYFAGVMVRLILVASPAVVLLAGEAVSTMLTAYARQMREGNQALPGHQTPSAKVQTKHANGKVSAKHTNNSGVGKPLRYQRQLAGFYTLCIAGALVLHVRHCVWVTSAVYSSPSIVMAARNSAGDRVLFDDFREGYAWLKENTPKDAKVMSWWDYGYQIASMANRTTIVDNNTWNSTHIAQVGRAMASTEEDAYPILRALGVDYVMVVFGGMAGYSSDDVNKLLWMVRIAQREFPQAVDEEAYLNQGEYRVDKAGTAAMLQSLLYKLCYFRFGGVMTEHGKPSGFDRVRRVEIGAKDFELNVVQEAYTTTNWIVRIYKVKDLDNRW